MGEGVVEEHLPELFCAHPIIDEMQKPVEPSRDRHHFGQRRRRIDPVEQRHRQLRVLPDIGGNAVLTHPARLLALDCGRHQIVGHNPPRDDQSRFPAEVERISARRAAKRIAAADMLSDAARGILDHAMIGKMRKERRLPPRAPAIGAGFVAQERRSGQPGVDIIAQRRWVQGLIVIHSSILQKYGL
jgi:hypothetical protein